MNNILHFGHETQTEEHAIRMAKATGHCFITGWPELSECFTTVELCIKFRRALATSLQEKGNGRHAAQTNPWPSEKNNATPKENIIAIFKQGRHRRRIHNGILDIKAHCKGDWSSFWNPVSYKSCLAFDASMELELSETCQESQGTARTTSPRLERSRLAAYKKKPKSLGLTWFSSTKAAFCLPQMLEEPGHLKGKLRFFRWRPPIGIKYPPFLLSAFRPKGDGLPSLCAFIQRKTFTAMKWCVSLSTCCTESKVLFSCCGIETKFMLKPMWSESSWKPITASMQMPSRLSRQTLTPMKAFGSISKGMWQIAFRTTLSILKSFCNLRPISFDIREGFYGLALQLRSCHGHS